MARNFVGPVEGGANRLSLPTHAFDFNALGVHATGRSQVMAQTLLHVAYLKATGLIGSREAAVSYTGAKYQDFKGSSGYVCAHRATLSVTMMDRNLADFALRPLRPQFQALLIAPQAVTDPLPPPANYGDRLFEIVSAEPTIQMVEWVLRRQPPNQPVEVNMVLDAITELIFKQYPKAYEKAIDKAKAIRRDRGWSEFQAFEEPASQRDSRAAQKVHEVMQELRMTGPQSPLVDDRMNELEFQAYGAGPSQFGNLVDIYLATCATHAQHFPPPLILPSQIKEGYTRLDEAAAPQQPSSEGSVGSEPNEK